MSSVSAALGGFSAPYTLTHKGKTYTTRHVKQKVKSEFERWLEKEARDTILAMKPDLEPEEFDRLIDRFNDQKAEGRFAYHGEMAQRTLKKPGGTLKMACLIFQCSEEEMIDLMMERGDEVKMILESIMRESFPDKIPESGRGQGQEGNDPN